MFLRIAILFAIPMLALQAEDFNAIVLRQIQTMPQGGGYAVTKGAHDALAAAMSIDSAGVHIVAKRACPSYCSSATYLVFLKTLGALQKSGTLQLTSSHWEALLPRHVPDGEGIWGRWNANGPGTPRLFHELQLGENFTSFSKAKSGDFMKIFWTDAVGRNERGHSVIYLGTEIKDGIETVRFWSSNNPGGYGEKSVPKSKIARAIFSRLKNPKNLMRLMTLTSSDPYLARLIYRESTFTEALKMSGVK